jgi:hypothetical protein
VIRTPLAIDLVSLLAVIVFALSWFFLARTDEGEGVVRLFFRSMMIIGAAIGVFALILRFMT